MSEVQSNHNVLYGGFAYKHYINSDGNSCLVQEKNKYGLKVTVIFSSDKIKNEKATKSLKDFLINN